MKKVFLILILSFPLYLRAQDAGNSGLTFLKLGADARTVSLSGLGASAVGKTASLFYNPAFIPDSNGYVGFTHNNYLQGVNSENFGVNFQWFGLPLGISINTTSVNDIEIRTKPGDAEGTFSVHYFSAGLSSAFNLARGIRFGATVKYLYEGMLADEAYGYAFDFGIRAEGIMKNVTFGLALRNLGDMNNLRSVPTKVPADVRAGAKYLLNQEAFNVKISALGGIQKYLSENKIHFHFGTEILYKERFALRVGYVTNYDSKNFSAGIGVKWNGFYFDYAFVPYKYDLGSVHFISITANITNLF